MFDCQLKGGENLPPLFTLPTEMSVVTTKVYINSQNTKIHKHTRAHLHKRMVAPFPHDCRYLYIYMLAYVHGRWYVSIPFTIKGGTFLD